MGKPAGAVAAHPQSFTPSWIVTGVLLFLAAQIAAFIVYWPSLAGDFVFDDRSLPMFSVGAATMPASAWLHVRPLLMFTYYLNYHLAGLDTVPYHTVNVFLHGCCAVWIFYALRRILEMAGIDANRRFVAALFGSALFLVHPMNTEAVSYIASRSETLSVFFFLAAFNLFLYRPRREITFVTTAGILVLYGLAMSCKEHTAMLPAALLLTDYYFNPGFSLAGIRRNWKLYAPIAIAALGGLAFFSTYIVSGSNLGFGLKEFTWYQYFFTQCRVFFVYLRLFLFPFGQSVDYQFPVSHTLWEHGAIFYALALVALIVAAVVYRKRYPLASCGFLLTLALLAPTSSFLPIKDTMADRRLYLPFIGMVLMTAEIVVRLPRRKQWVPVSLSAICLVMAGTAMHRNEAWQNMEALWKDVVNKDPRNTRAVMGLADAYALNGRCAEAIPYFLKARELDPSDYRNTYNLASAYDCVNDMKDARVFYEKALAIKPTAEVWAHLAMIQMKDREFDLAYASLDKAQALDSTYLLGFTYRGVLDLAFGKFDKAEQDFQMVLNLAPTDQLATRGLDRAKKHERQF